MRLRDWVCAGCHAINLGQRQSCFSCGAVKCANARAATRQVTEIDEAGPPPRMTDTSAAGLHLASTDAACNVEGTRPAAYYAEAAARRGGFKPESFRVRASEAVTAGGRGHGARPGQRPRGDASVSHRDAIAALKADQQARRAAAEAQRAEERRERQRRREATGDARSRGVKTSGAESDQPLGELLASRDEVDTLSASLCAVMSGVVHASTRPPEQGWRGHAD
uniref:RanBP2-type domain-containing protein n=1 Tax=Emiliania huxleyi TaxID=2903 RepID=A0A7S3RNK1_EMIHU